MRRALLLLLTLGLWGCFDPIPTPPLEDWESCDATTPTPASLPGWPQVADILTTRCVGCHGAKSSLPLDTFDQVSTWRGPMARAIRTRNMPPWPPNPCCTEYRDDPSLTPRERDLLLAWLTSDLSPADPYPKTLTPPAPPTAPPHRIEVKLPGHTPSLARGADSLHCFLIDPGLDAPTSLTGFDLVSSAGLVHHALAHIVKAEHVPRLTRLDEASPEPGWDCWGEAVGPTHAQVIGGWAPGYEPVSYPDGLGFVIEPGDRLLMNMHYAVSTSSTPEHTSLRLHTSESTTKSAISLGLAHPLWLFDGAMPIDAGDPMTLHRATLDPRELYTGEKPLTIHGVSLHMHALGVQGTIAILRADGTWDCLLHVDDFDESWQGQYLLEEPRHIEDGDVVYVECRWDNSAANQPTGSGGPRRRSWGTDAEMCTGFLLGSTS